ncbi:hypothetical protein MKEN_01010200 [Mycena kentingensis (nom. inval.)]|nr:hypothetical protein MKEN_01010200 [Mycena kentingensis (nom. inval.)]
MVLSIRVHPALLSADSVSDEATPEPRACLVHPRLALALLDYRSDSDSDDGNDDIDCAADEDTCLWWDDWPPDFDGTGLFQRLEEMEAAETGDGDARDAPALPIFRFDVREVLNEVEAVVGNRVVDIPNVGKGANYFGMHLRLADDRNILARLARVDVNRLEYDDSGRMDELIAQQIADVQFEGAVYDLLRNHPDVVAAKLLHARPPEYKPELIRSSRDVRGRALFVFERMEGSNTVWPDLVEQRADLLKQCARIRASLFLLSIPDDFLRTWITRRPHFPAKHLPASLEITPTRDFALSLMLAKVEECIPDEGEQLPDAASWNSEPQIVSTRAVHTKSLLRRLIPLCLPQGDELYRLVLEHGDFGLHNMSIREDTAAVTSVYDWDSHILPALLSNPQLAIYVDLQLDDDCNPVISRAWNGITEEQRAEQMEYSRLYYQALDACQPRYLPVLRAGKDARHIWAALVSWASSEEDHEIYFCRLGEWANERLLGIGAL